MKNKNNLKLFFENYNLEKLISEGELESLLILTEKNYDPNYFLKVNKECNKNVGKNI